MKTRLIPAVAAFAFCLTLVPALLAQDAPNQPRIITVTGTTEVKVAPDEAILTLGVDSRDKILAVAKTDNDNRVKKLLSLARAAGVEQKNIETSALSMGPEYSDQGIPTFLDYLVSQTITMTLTDLSKYEDLMTGCLNAGVNRVDGINFVVADPKKYREQARLEAIQAAHDKAVTMAAQLGQTIGKPWEIVEVTDMDAQEMTANSQFVAQYGLSRPMQQEGPTVAGGEVAIQATVRVSFQLE